MIFYPSELRELVLHIAACYEAGRLGVLPPYEGLNADVRQLMAKPLPRAVWRELRPYQNAHFREFVEARLAEAEDRLQLLGRERRRLEHPLRGETIQLCRNCLLGLGEFSRGRSFLLG